MKMWRWSREAGEGAKKLAHLRICWIYDIIQINRALFIKNDKNIPFLVLLRQEFLYEGKIKQ